MVKSIVNGVSFLNGQTVIKLVEEAFNTGKDQSNYSPGKVESLAKARLGKRENVTIVNVHVSQHLN